MLYFDTNIFVYAADTKSPYRAITKNLIEYCVQQSIPIQTSTETIQEIVHLGKYSKTLNNALIVARETMTIVEQLLAVNKEVIQRYLRLVAKYPRLESRDLIHLASCVEFHVPHLVTYDKKLKHCTEVKVSTPEEFLNSKP